MTVEITHEKTGEIISPRGVRSLCRCGWESAWWASSATAQEAYDEHIASLEKNDEPAMDLKSIELMVSLMQQNHRDYAATTQALLDARRARIFELEAKLHVIVTGVVDLFTKGVMPTETAVIRAALHPNQDKISEQLRRLYEADEEKS
jgi:hypothetical protein